MNALIHAVLPFILTYKYGALFLVTFIAALILPIPPGALIMGAAAFSAQGYLHFGLVLLFSILGNIAGDNVGYFLARKYGYQTLQKIGFKKILNSQQYKTIERQMQRRPGFIIFISRFEVFANLSVNIIAGMAKVPYRKYLMHEIPGEILQVGLYASLGYFFGNNWERINAKVGVYTLILAIMTIAAILIFWKKIKKANSTT